MVNLINKVRTGIMSLTLVGAITAGVSGGILFSAVYEKNGAEKMKCNTEKNIAYLSELNSKIKGLSEIVSYGLVSSLTGAFIVDRLDKKMKYQ